MANKYHNNGPIGERDYEDNLAQVETRNGYKVSPMQSSIDSHAAKVASVSKQRFAMIEQLTADFVKANGRRPLRSEMDRINRQVNSTLGL